MTPIWPGPDGVLYWAMGNQAIVNDMTEKLHKLDDRIAALQAKVANAHGHDKVAWQEKLEELYEERRTAQRRMIDVT